MKFNVASGAALAAAAAALVVGATLPTSNAAADYKVKCFGQNACKGHGACKSMGNACKGQNACKGKGFVEMTKEECGKVDGGKFVEAQADVPR